ncbi:MAG: histidine kinase [Tannerellaceae bacterium]|jgi:signal transduction histidine kinase|nr:histidine kinase [Tannerellaceae bacterium]
MKKIICSLLFVLPSLTLLAQTNIDSLVRMCAVYKGTNSDSLNKYAHKGVLLAQEEKNEAMLTTFYRYAGISYFQKQEYDTASFYLDKALELAIRLGDRSQEADVYLTTGYMYGTRSDIKSLIEYLLKALPIFETLRDNEKVIETLVGVGSAYRRTGNKEMAVRYVNKAKNMVDESKNIFLKGLTYFELGAVESDVEKIVEYELKTIEYARASNNKELENLGNQALALTYLSDELKNYDKALMYAKECYRIACEQGAKYYIYSALTMLSNIYYKTANYKECENVSLQAWAMDSTNLAEARNLARNISLANIYLGNEKKAATFLNKYGELTNEYTTESYHEKMVEMEARYESEKKEMRIAILEGERKLYAGLGIAIVIALLSIIGLLFYRHRSATQKQKIAEQQIKQLEQEKELIAVRSALDAEKAEREIIARDLHDGVGAMLSVVKNNMNIMKSYSVIENKEANYFNKALDGLDKSIVELRRVAHHIMPAVLVENGLFAALDDFCRSIPEAEFHYTKPERRFDPEKELILYRCAYELVNNALKHSASSRIEVHLNVDEETAYLSVVDNGCGFDTQATPQGMGIKNLHTRLSAFDGHMEIYSGPGKGTEANVELRI